MEFKYALKLIAEGKKVRRRCWGNSKFYINLKYETICALEKDDCIAEDWELFANSEPSEVKDGN